MSHLTNETQSPPHSEPANDEIIDEDASYETESAFKPLLWLLIPFVSILIYGALA